MTASLLYIKEGKEGKKGFVHKAIVPKAKFAITSTIATSVDYALYMVLVTYFLTPIYSNIISASVGMLVNFTLQKKYIFVLNRKLSHSFLLSITFSLIGVALGTFFISLLIKSDFFKTHQYITKLIVTGTIFFYNFYTKRFAFEKK